MPSKVSIIGCGRVGMSAAYAMLLRETVHEIVLVDRNQERIEGEQLDLQDCLGFVGTTHITAAKDLSDTKDSTVIVCTAGVAQEPGQSRLELVQKNTEVIEKLLPELLYHSPHAVVLMVTNPVDILTYKAAKLLKLPKGRVFGSGTSLDTARFRVNLSEIFHVNPKNIHAFVLGEHGDTSFPVVATAAIGGQLLETLPGYDASEVQKSYEKVRDQAQRIINAKGSTHYAIGVLINQLVNAIVRDLKRVFILSVPLHGEYGQHDVSVSVPCVLGKAGVERVLVGELSEEEKKLMDKSVATLKEFLTP